MFCKKCQAFWQSVVASYKFPTSTNPSESIQWPQYQTVLHRSMNELRSSAREKCPICHIILCTPTEWEINGVLASNEALHEIILEINTKTGSLPALFVTFFDSNKTQLVPRGMLAAYNGLLQDEEFGAALDRAFHSDNSSTGSDAALELGAFWLRRCLDQHDKCRQTFQQGEVSWLPTRLLDVSGNTIRLIETKETIGKGDDRNYIALSHCWGKVQIITTLKKNYEEHKKRIKPAELSKTFSDAIHVTRKLGFRYIWIDSLCIIQDSKSDWQAEAATMCNVYRYAILKIAAASAAGGNEGCFRERDGLVQFPFLVDLPPAATDNNNTRPHRALFQPYGRTKGLEGPTVEPPLYGRSWVLQEQLLSPRMLIFDGLQIRWECNTGHGSERTPLGGLSRHIGHQKAIRAGIFDDGDFFCVDGSDDPELDAKYQLQYWNFTVMDYTHRGMTQPSDRLIAIDGIAQALSKHTHRKYYAGLWGQDPWLGLLWSISHYSEYTSTIAEAFDFDRNKHVRHKEDIAPSWSWVSVTVPVVYPMVSITTLHRACDVVDISVYGTHGKSTGKLKIRGHVRRGYVDAIYPYSIREAAEAVPHMTAGKPNSSNDKIVYRGRSFRAMDYFVFSDDRPTGTFNHFSGHNWRLVRGHFRPDELIAPSTQLAFLAIAERNRASDRQHSMHMSDTDPLLIFAIVLVPTGKEGEYRRVGYSVWEDCAWYGFMCGDKTKGSRYIDREEGWRGVMAGRDLENMGWHKRVDSSGHKHLHEGKAPDWNKYHASVRVEEKVVTVV